MAQLDDRVREFAIDLAQQSEELKNQPSAGGQDNAVIRLQRETTKEIDVQAVEAFRESKGVGA